jgi:hypothetical protein
MSTLGTLKGTGKTSQRNENKDYRQNIEIMNETPL